jgi:phosphate transport system substrate-binding protein
MENHMKLQASFLTLAIAAGFGFGSVAQAADITGAGATFPYPIYAKWADAYKKETGTGMNYQSIGSGGGIKQIKAKTVDFGASDMPLKPADLADAGLTQFPTVMGGVVPVYNLPGIAAGAIKLDPATLAKIFMGEITKWDDPAIKALNPGVALPSTALSVVHRSDGSGTTFIFTNYLSKVSPEWKTKVGEGTAVKWPAGVGGKGNEGVASFVKQIKGSIGYVEYAYALQNKMTNALLKNKAGNYVSPNEKSFMAAAANANWSIKEDFYEILTDEPGADSWPITGATFILMHKMQNSPEQAAEVLKFFKWAYAKGDQMAMQLDYIPMPDNVVKLIETSWKQKLSDSSANAIYK